VQSKGISATAALVVLALAAFLGVRAYAAQLATNTIHVEGDPWSGYATFRDPKFMAGSGYTYSYASQPDQKTRAKDLASGQINFLVTTLDQYVKQHDAGKVVGIIDQSQGADALFANTVQHPYLRSLNQVPRLLRECAAKGRKPILAYSGDTPSDFLLHELSYTRDNLQLANFTLVSVDQSSTALTMLKQNKADLAVLWEPDTSAAIKSGYTRVASSKDVPNMIVDVIVASNEVIKNHPETVQTLVNAFYARRQQDVANAQAFRAYIAQDGQMSLEDTDSLLKGIHLYNGDEANQFLNKPCPPFDEAPMQTSLSSIGSVIALANPGLQTSADMINGAFVAALPR